MTHAPSSSALAALSTLREELAARQRHAEKLGNDSARLRTRLSALETEIPEALGHGRDASALQRERTEAEAALRDIEPAGRYAQARVAEADKALAVAEIPGVRAELEQDSREFQRLLRELHSTARRIQNRRTNALSRWNRSELGGLDHPEHPRLAISFSVLGASVYSLLKDFTPEAE